MLAVEVHTMKLLDSILYCWHRNTTWLSLVATYLHTLLVTTDLHTTMQTFLLFNFWRSRVMTGEEQLVTVSNFVERAPTAAKALIENVDVIRESDLAVEIMQVGGVLQARGTQACRPTTGRPVLPGLCMLPIAAATVQYTQSSS